MEWSACRQCGHRVPRERWAAALAVCDRCGAHGRFGFEARMRLLDETGDWEELDAEVASLDPLQWRAEGENYPEMLEQAAARGRRESFRAVRMRVGGQPCLVGWFDFGYMGGTLGAVAGEKVARLLDRGRDERLPVVIFTASGGARMQEGMVSLFQMAKIAVAIAELREAGVPLVTVICDPTTGGVAASLAFMGDAVLAEPGALAGFAGPRVILQTIGEEMPGDIQRVERLCRDGFVDEVVPRSRQRLRLAHWLAALAKARGLQSPA